MARKSETGSSTSSLVSTPALVIWSIGVIALLLLNLLPAAGLCFGFLLLGLMVRFWGERAMRQVTLHVTCSQPHLYPGQTTTLTYQLENNKILPLLWLELSQNQPENACLTPEFPMEAYHEPGSKPDTPLSLRQTFSYLGSYQSLRVERTWCAARRGLYIVHRLAARSGDGFGLVAREQLLPAGEIPILAVYPRLVEVDLAPFLNLQWNHAAGHRGWMEDHTILRGNREYQPGDNWKSINWRMAAREQGLPINLYQTVRPHSIRFIFDGESFLSVSENVLEETLEILASVLTGLADRQMELSLSLSRSRRFPAVTLTSGPEGNIQELLLYLAGYHCAARPDPKADESAKPPVYLPSAFAEDVISASGSTWLLTYSGSCLPASLLPRLTTGDTWILCHNDWEACQQAGFHALPLSRLRI